VRHWGGPVGAVLASIGAQLSGEDKAKHFEYVKAFAKGFAIGNPAFSLSRFVMRCGYPTHEAVQLAKDIWDDLPRARQRKLIDAERFIHATGWWRV
jgi:hypothetical protein